MLAHLKMLAGGNDLGASWEVVFYIFFFLCSVYSEKPHHPHLDHDCIVKKTTWKLSGRLLGGGGLAKVDSSSKLSS